VTEKEFWLTCADNWLFTKLEMPPAVRDIADRCWYVRRYYDRPDLSVDDPEVDIACAAAGFDTDLLKAYVAAMARVQAEDFKERLREMEGEW